MTDGQLSACFLIDDGMIQSYLLRQKLTDGHIPGDSKDMGTLERRRREKDERRNRIIQSAEKVFLSKGYQATTMDDVAAEAELGKGTLYLYFKNKDELILALAMRLRMRMIDGFDEAIQRAETGLELLEGIASSYCTIVESNKNLFMLSFHVMAAGFDLDPTTPTYALWRESGEWSLRIVINAIERGRRDGSIRPDLDAPMVAMHMFSGMFGATLVQYGGTEEHEKSEEILVDPALVLTSFAEFFIESIKNTNGDRKGA